MTEINRKTTIHRYYNAWASQDYDTVREVLHNKLRFISPQDSFNSTEEFLSECWKYSKGLTDVRFIHEVYQDTTAFVILLWIMEGGSRFADAEYVELDNDKIKHILVVNNDPSFIQLID